MIATPFLRVVPSEWPSTWLQLWQIAAPLRQHPLDDENAAAKWSSSTRRHVENAIGLYLGWLRSRHELDPNKPVELHFERQAVLKFVEEYSVGRADLTVATVVKGLAYFHRAIKPPVGLVWLTRLAHRMMNEALPSRPKPPRMASLQELTELGLHLMRSGIELRECGDRLAAQQYRNGLMFVLLVSRPLRLRNFSSLRFGDTLSRVSGIYRVSIPEYNTKTKAGIEFDYSTWLTEWLDLYLSDYRHRIPWHPVAKDEGWLWIGRGGAAAMRPTSVSAIIVQTAQRYLGRPVSPHLFRDCAATDIAVYDPVHVGITKTVLQHRGNSCAQKHYNQARSLVAISRLEEVVSGLIDPSV